MIDEDGDKEAMGIKGLLGGVFAGIPQELLVRARLQRSILENRRV